MATPFVSTLLSWDTYSESVSLAEGAGFPTAGRTRWDFTLRVASVTSVTVVIQGGPADDDDDYGTLGTFNGGAITSAGNYTLTSYGNAPDFTVAAYHEWLRAKVTAQTGDAAIECFMAGAFFDPASDDVQMLPKAVRDYQDGLTRLSEQAERDVRGLLLVGDRSGSRVGRLSPALTASWALDEVRAMCAEQVEHLFIREMLSREARKGDVGAAAELRRMGDLKADIMDRVRRLQPVSAAIWRGR